MPQEIGLPKYYDFKTLKPGSVVVDMGEYIGETEGKFGPQFNFLEVKNGQQVVISGGSIKWRVEQGHIKEGGVYQIHFEGKGKVEKGTYAGKEVNNFKFARYKDEELTAAGFRPQGVLPAAVKADPQPLSAPVAKEALDDLD